MKREAHWKKLMRVALASAAAAADSAGNDVLVNPGFEEPLATIRGDNFPGDLPGWTLHTLSPPCANGHNVVLADGSPYEGGPDSAVEGNQYYDICGAAGYLEQPFTLTTASEVRFGAWFSRRDTGTGGGNVAIYDAGGATLIMESPIVFVLENQNEELWVKSTATIPNLAPGSYLVRLNLDDTANVDAAFVYLVPEVLILGYGTPGSVTETALDSAIAAAPGRILFNTGGAPITLPFSGTKTITGTVAIVGDGKVTFSGQGTAPLFVVNPGTSLKLDGIALERGSTTGSGGAVRNMGLLQLIRVRISRCVAGAHGGAVQNSGSLIATDSIFEYNRAGINGGAIDNTGSMSAGGCVATNNAAGFRGGGFYNYLGSIITAGCKVKWNTAGAYGGGIAADGGTLQSNNDKVRGNRSNAPGGGFSLNTDARINGTEFSLNTANGAGGGVDVAGGMAELNDVRLYTGSGFPGGGLATHAGTTTVTRALIQYNRNPSPAVGVSGGGGVWVDAGTLSLKDCRISDNWSTSFGGGVMVDDGQRADLHNCIVARNTANCGQLWSGNGQLYLEDCIVGPGSCNGIWSDGGFLSVSRCSVSGHSGGGYGGGVTLNRGATARIENSTIYGNSSLGSGGGLLLGDVGSSRADLTNVTIAYNSAPTGGNLYIGPGSNVFLNYSIIAGAAQGGNCAGRQITSSRYSISSDNHCGLLGPGDRNGTDPLLGPLQNNGGPTLTYLPLAGSPAIDAIPATESPPPLDQRGRNRPAGSGYDIGAVEVNAGGGIFHNLPPSIVFDGNDRGDDDGDGSRDVDELIAGTDPNDPADVFRLSYAPANLLPFSFTTKTGRFYRLYVSPDNVPNPLAQWTDAIQATIPGNDGIFSFGIVSSAGVPRRFYIVRAMATDGPWPP